MRNLPISHILPFGLYLSFLALEQTLGDARWLYAVKVALVAASLFALRRHYAELRIAPPWRGRMAALVVGVLVFVLWIALDQPWAMLGQSKGFNPTAPDGSIDWPLALARIAGATLVVPLMEELFWRSFLMRWLDRPDFLALAPNAVSRRSVLLSAVVFGFEHHLWLAGILAGLVYAELYRRSGNLWIPVLAHGVTNGALGLWVLHTANWQLW